MYLLKNASVELSSNSRDVTLVPFTVIEPPVIISRASRLLLQILPSTNAAINKPLLSKFKLGASLNATLNSDSLMMNHYSKIFQVQEAQN